MATLTQFELTPKDDAGEALQAFLTDILPDTRSYICCTSVEFGISPEDPRLSRRSNNEAPPQLLMPISAGASSAVI